MRRPRSVPFILISALLLSLAPSSRPAPAAPAERAAPAAPIVTTPAAPAGGASPSPGWLDQVQRDLAEQEYHVSWQGAPNVREIEPSWQAPNRAHGFRTYFTTEGIRIVPRAETTPSWRWGLSLVGYGRGDEGPSAVPKAGLAPSGNRVAYRRGAIEEFYENGADGLEQGFVLPAPPRESDTGKSMGADGAEGPGTDAGVESVHLDLALWGDLTPRIAEDGQVIDFVTAVGAPAVHYAGLKVTDARGTVLRSWMEGFVGEGPLADPGAGPEADARAGAGGGIRLLFDDRDAAYPVTIDPLATAPAWTVQGDQAQGGLGMGAATAGDVNGDGHSDVIVSANGYDTLFVDNGKAWVYLGSASGLSTTSSWTVTGDMASANLGNSVATAGDVNGDGYSDVIVGAYGYSNGEALEGRAYLYLGSSSGLSTTPAWSAEGNQNQGLFGSAVATAGDVNGDGYSDVIVGAREYDDWAGRAWVYLGSSSGLAPTPVWTVRGSQDFEYFGESVSTAGDVNGDGYADIIVGSPVYATVQGPSGHAALFLGSASGPSPVAAWTMDGELQSQFGGLVGTAGDVNGDGYADVVVGGPTYRMPGQTDYIGRVSLYMGSALGLATSPASTLVGSQANVPFGASVATAGDVNGDGFADVIVGAPSFTADESREGRAYVYLGSALGLVAAPIWTADGNQVMTSQESFYGFGHLVGPAGDVNGDGYADVIVASPRHDTTVTNGGKVSVFLGSPAGPATTPGWTAGAGQLSADFGHAVATAGDVNGDGFADVIVGAIGYDNGETDEGLAQVYLGSASGLSATPAWTAEGNQPTARFGWSVASAGDYNSDGYSDVLVGAHLADNGETDEGRVYLYLGSAAGLAATPLWIGEGNQAGAQYGSQVASAGDINGDGYDEFLVGAPRYDAPDVDEGRVYIYPGSSAGPGSTAAWIREGNQVGARFGTAVGTAGDVNRDGFADVLVGAELYDNGQTNEGRAFLYLGAAGGLNLAPAWTAENNEVSSFMGSAVATAGDVNGDGYADVLIGAPGHDGIWGDQGRAYLYQGNAAGLAFAPSWTMDLVQDGTGLGTTLGTAGDVNGDGFADVIVGASGYSNDLSEEGAAFVFLGAASGLSTAPAWTKEGDGGFFYGNAVASAGDVNGDGYADIIVGAYFFVGTSGFPEGQAFVYYGNGGAGLSVQPRQRRADDVVPIANGGRIHAPELRLKARGRAPFGRGRARLEWELKPLGQTFDGTGLMRSAAPIDTGTGTGGATFSEALTGLQAGPYHWRMRLLYDGVTTPFAQRSRWFTMPWNGWNETDLKLTRTLGGYVWSDLDRDGLREPGEPLVSGTSVILYDAAGNVMGVGGTWRDGIYHLEAQFPGPYRLEFLPACYGLSPQDQGANDLLDSDPDPATRRTILIGPTLTDEDPTRWSAGIAGSDFSIAPPDQPVFIAGARMGPNPGEILLDIEDPNDPVRVDGYNLYRTANPALPYHLWDAFMNRHDTRSDPGIQLNDFGAPNVGTAYFYQVTAGNSACSIEGPH